MAIRTTDDLVKETLAPGQDYDLDGNPSLDRAIKAANLVTDRVAACAVRKGITLSAEELTEIETWLAAHYYVMSDQNYASKSTGGQLASFQGKTEKGIEASKYGQTAIDIDASGCLAALTLRARASSEWLGKNPSDQINWQDR